jgi:hypothetical protein
MVYPLVIGGVVLTGIIVRLLTMKKETAATTAAMPPDIVTAGPSAPAGISAAVRAELETLALTGAQMTSDSQVARARTLRDDPRYRWGFDIGSAVARGSSIPGPGQTRIRTLLGPNIFGSGPTQGTSGSAEAELGFGTAQTLQHSITKAKSVVVTASPSPAAPAVAVVAPPPPPPIVIPSVIAPAVTVSVPPAFPKKAKVTTSDPSPRGDLAIRVKPSDTAAQIPGGGADKNGIVTILGFVDDTWAEVAWDGGVRPAGRGFAHKKFLIVI